MASLTITSSRRSARDAWARSSLPTNSRGRLVKWIGDAALVVFDSATLAIHCSRAIQTRFVAEAERGGSALPSSVKLAAIHWGTLHIMQYTMMGEDIDVLRTLVPRGFGREVLMTGVAVDAALAEGCFASDFTAVERLALRDCGSRTRWLRRFPYIPVFRVNSHHGARSATSRAPGFPAWVRRVIEPTLASHRLTPARARQPISLAGCSVA